MRKNKVQFQKGYSLFEFMSDYETEEDCQLALFNYKWPNGFKCPECGSNSYCSLKSRNIYQCNKCHHQTSLTSHTIFSHTKLPLKTWFLGIHLITQAKTGIAAIALSKQIGVSYNTAWQMKQKVMQVMKEADDKHPLSGIIQVDDVYWGGENSGGKRGRGSENKTPFIAAVELNNENHPIRMNLNKVSGFKLDEVKRWAKVHLSPESSVISDGLNCFKAVKDAGCTHVSIVTGGGVESVKKEQFKWVNTMIGNVKMSMYGAYHAINSKHLPRYLAEFCYRFNRRFDLESIMGDFMANAVKTPPMPNRLLKMAELTG